VAYQIGVVYVKFIGTHAQYDKVDAATAVTFARHALRDGMLLERPAIHRHLVLGAFNRSSQHRIVEQFLGTRPELQQVSSSRAFSEPASLV
jgi:hypothetical protein